MILFSTLFLSMFITIALIPFLEGYAVKFNAVDSPDGKRKNQPHPIPIMGGVVMAIGALIPILFWATLDRFMIAILIGSGIIVSFGFLDDIKELGYKTKFAAQLTATVIVIFLGGVHFPDYLESLFWSKVFDIVFFLPLTLFFIIGVTNAINLSDGLDGLAGGISIYTYAGIGCLAYLSNNNIILLICVGVVGAIFGFLRFNTHPAVIFMGDAGSQTLGFMAAVLSISLVQNNPPYSAALPLLLAGLPILDTLTVMIERIIKRESPFIADKRHFHHRLLRLGLYQTEAVFCIYILQALIITSAVWFRFYQDWMIISLYLCFSFLVTAGFMAAEKKRYTILRSNFFDNVIKRGLKRLKEKKVFIKFCFKTIYGCIFLLLFLTASIPSTVPPLFLIFSITLFLLIVISILYKKEWLGPFLRFFVYFFVPFLVFISEVDNVSWLSYRPEYVYNLLFGVLAFFVILVLKFTKRKKGFTATPMDFLIFGVALIVPNSTMGFMEGGNMELVVVKIIIFIFSYDVIIGELRGELRNLGISTAAVFIPIFARGIF